MAIWRIIYLPVNPMAKTLLSRKAVVRKKALSPVETAGANPRVLSKLVPVFTTPAPRPKVSYPMAIGKAAPPKL